MNNKIGEITSFVCSSTYIPRGCLPCNGGEYSKEQFKDLWNNYLADGKLLTCTYTEYANDISTYGQCAKFAIDTTNNKFKVPTIKDGSYITQALSDNELGKSYNESLPNIRSHLGLNGQSSASWWADNGQSGALYGEKRSVDYGQGKTELQAATVESGSSAQYNTVVFDASRSSSTYQDGAKVQGDNVRLRFFVVVANGEINQSVMDWSAWATSLETKQDISTAVNYNNITNCITEIPQDIKLELNNGTLTLKAGSKVYVPNGFESDGTTKKFDAKIIESDIIFSALNYITNLHIISLLSSNKIQALTTDTQQFSGDTAPTPTNLYAFWYDTTNNIVKYTIDNGSTWTESCSLPLGLISIEINKGITSINQVFNGFGYIGSTVYALPGVKGLIPNGRNADGSLKSIEWTSNKVIISTLTFGKQSYYLGTYNNEQALGFYGETITKYDEKDNIIIDTYANVIRLGWSFWGECTSDSNNKITSFTPKTVFHALDYNDKSTISSWSMPSSRYINLTLGASGSAYTAPANGFVHINKNGDPNQFINLINTTKNYGVNAVTSASPFALLLILSVNRGDVFTIDYNLNGTTNLFRFIYAEGEN